ncbi:MAG: sulfurtransferase [Comamonadaceae bacterium]|jgi:rhodanese-related sulfurtransferase|nr:sulfurtransferase [Comamonadaceae bacterium]
MIAQIRPAELAAWLAQAQADSGQQPLLLDVREPWELQTASVRADGAAFLHMPMASVPLRLAELGAERPIACLCHHGGRSMQVAYYLQQHGFDQLANVAGGIDAWARELAPQVPRY